MVVGADLCVAGVGADLCVAGVGADLCVRPGKRARCQVLWFFLLESRGGPMCPPCTPVFWLKIYILKNLRLIYFAKAKIII